MYSRAGIHMTRALLNAASSRLTRPHRPYLLPVTPGSLFTFSIAGKT